MLVNCEVNKKSAVFSPCSWFFNLFLFHATYSYLCTSKLVIGDVLQRKRHYWKLDSNALTLYKDENTSRYYKVRLSQVLCPRLCVWDSLYMLLYLLLMNDSDVQQLWLGDQAVGLSSRQHRFKSCWDYTCQLSTTNVGWSFPLSALSRFLSLSLRPSCSTR